MLFHWGCSSGRQNKFSGLLVTKQELFRQHQFLGTVPEELQRSPAQVLNEHFSSYSWPEEEGEGEDAAPSSQNSRTEFKK